MKDFGEAQYRFEDLDDDGSQYLVRIEVVDMDTVDISQREDGEIIVTSKEVTDDDDVAPVSGKYRLEPEDGLYRLYALRDISHIRAGTRGGLVDGPSALHAEGDCWIYEGSTVTGGARVVHNATVRAGSVVRGDVLIGGTAAVMSGTIICEQGHGSIGIEGDAYIADSTVTTVGEASIRIGSGVRIEDSTISSSSETETLRLSCCLIRGGHVRNSFEVLSVATVWGPLSAYRDRHTGGLTFAVGCSRASSREDLIWLAGDNDVPALELQMLGLFVDMAEIARDGWVRDEAPKSDPAPSFSDMAQRARDAVNAMNATDQYGSPLL